MQSLLPRIRFWNQKLVRHGYASVSNKITALNGDDVCSIYGCGTDFLLELAGGAAPGGGAAPDPEARTLLTVLSSRRRQASWSWSCSCSSPCCRCAVSF